MSIDGKAASHTRDPEQPSNPTTEKGHRRDPARIDGYYLDTQYLSADENSLKTASDGHTVLIPQPTSDPNDPLNWSNRKKNTILFVITVLSFLPDYGSSLGAVTLIPQAT